MTADVEQAFRDGFRAGVTHSLEASDLLASLAIHATVFGCAGLEVDVERVENGLCEAGEALRRLTVGDGVEVALVLWQMESVL